MKANNSTSDDNLQTQLTETTIKYQQLLQQTHDQALFRNETQIKRWQDYRKEHEELSTRLLSFRDQLSHKVMVPLGKKALMRGALVHTNEILVCLGDGWFAKRSANQASEICHRRIEHCDEMLKKLKREEELLESRKSFPFESDAFSGTQTQEVIEPYDEEAEKQWREIHRQKEREYHQKLAELRKAQQNSKIETEEDLWSRLEALELQEDLEDELNRMEGNEEDEETEESEDYSSDSEESEVDTGQQENKSEDSVIKDNVSQLKRRVSFKEDNVRNKEDEKISDDMIVITFKHSNEPSSITSESGDQINSPADIYAHYLKNRQPKSILKPTSSTEKAHSMETNDSPVINRLAEEVRVHDEKSVDSTEPLVKAISEVVMEREPSTPSVSNSKRPVSRFKAARMANKR